MNDSPRVILTNDDGYGSPGIEAMALTLESVADVTVIAPRDDHSGIGRKMSGEVELEERERGYAVSGTPVDCVVVGLEELVPDADLVVAGCNKGANVGAPVLGRSGTVSAAVESAFFGVPAIAASQYIPVGAGDFAAVETTPEDYTEAVSVTARLLEVASEDSLFEGADYVNVNAPAPDRSPAPLEITRPAGSHAMSTRVEGARITMDDPIWTAMDEGTLEDPPGTDRRAIVEGRTSVSPLRVPHATGDLDRFRTAIPQDSARPDSG